MKYLYKRINTISKFSITDFFIKDNENLSSIFWNTIFDYDYLLNFIETKYIPYKLKNNSLKKEEINELKFIIKKIKIVKNKINIISDKNIKCENVFLSYILFTKIINLYNDYYKESKIKISLLRGLFFIYDYSISDDNIGNEFEKNFLNNNEFLKEFVHVLGIKNNLYENNSLYKLKIFWPDELIIGLYISKLLKENYPNTKIILDISEANEQYDFTQWKNLIKNKKDFFSKYLDFLILNKDYGNQGKNIQKYLNGEKFNFENLIHLSNGNFIEYEEKIDEKTLIEDFIKSINNLKPSKLYGKNSIYIRMFPYKCFWAKCNFCTINTQNSFSYNENFSYDYFINEWINYIKKNNIYSIVFRDEAITPKHIIKFAEKVIKNGLNIIYQFRTRFDKLYTKENCELLYKSGARYCGIGLESASDRINEEIGNKGLKNISLKEKIKIINNFDKAGISFHNYSIIGFPSETESESILTYNFIIKNIQFFNHYTATPNIFGLMKGSYIYNNKEKYGIQIDNKKENLLNLNFDFSYLDGKKRDINLYNKMVKNIHYEQFLPWLKGNKDFDSSNFFPKDFWDYIDRSSFFYKMKLIYKNNPYIEYKNINNKIIKEDLDNKLKSKFNISLGINIYFEDEKIIKIYDWINFLGFSLDLEYKNFFLNFNEEKSLENNLEINGIKKDKEFIDFLISNRIITLNSSL